MNEERLELILQALLLTLISLGMTLSYLLNLTTSITSLLVIPAAIGLILVIIALFFY